MARDHVKKRLTKSDLERVLSMADIFDHLTPEKKYTLRQIATVGKMFVEAKLEKILSSLKVVNDELKFLKISGTEYTDEVKVFYYLYSKNKTSQEAKYAIIEYVDVHFKTPLKTTQILKIKSLDDF